MSDFDPYLGLSPDHEVRQRLTQIGSQVGSPPNFDDLAEISILAEGMNAAMFARLSPLDDDKDAHDLALEVLDANRRLSAHYGETIYANHGGPQLDPSDQATMNRPYGILASNPIALHPLSKAWTWEHVAEKYLLPNHNVCDLQLTYSCDKTSAGLRFPVMAGEFIAIFASCQRCRDWFSVDFDKRPHDDVINHDLGTVFGEREHRTRND